MKLKPGTKLIAKKCGTLYETGELGDDGVNAILCLRPAAPLELLAMQVED